MYWLVDGAVADVTNDPNFAVEFVDTNGNGIVDRMQWIIPQLSEQDFQIVAKITIINVQSYPVVGGEWVVRFTTTGTADLTITAVNGTTFGQTVPNDLMFLELNDGTQTLVPEISGNSIIYRGYSSNAEGFERSLVLTEGAHHLEFTFGSDVQYAHNDAAAAPTVFFSGGTISQIIINWFRSVSGSGDTHTATLQYCIGVGCSTFTTLTSGLTLSSATTSYTHSPLTSGTFYNYRVTDLRTITANGATSSASVVSGTSTLASAASSTLTVIKAVPNPLGLPNVPLPSTFTMSVTGSALSGATSFPGNSAGTLVTAGSGSFSVSEIGPPGFTTTFSGCSGTLTAGGAATCSFTNTPRPSSLTVIKTVVNGGIPGATAVASDFTMSVTGSAITTGGTSFPGSPGTVVSAGSGTYDVTETTLPGYSSASSPACSGSLTLGGGAVCTWTNTAIPSSLTVIKTVVNGGIPGATAVASDFTMSVTGSAITTGGTSFPGNDLGTLVTAGSGSFSAGESGISGYVASFSGCTGDLILGGATTCTITNTAIPSSLTVIKTVVNGGIPGATATTNDFLISVSGSAITTGGTSFSGNDLGTLVTAGSGSFSAGESGISGYVASFSGCTGDLILGGATTCTITNTAMPSSLTVIKHVINNDGRTSSATAFTMLVTGSAIPTGATSFSGDESGTVVSAGSGSFNVGESGPLGYAASFSGCTGSLPLGGAATCSITNDDLPLSVVTKSDLCYFDFDSSLTGKQFRNILTNDPTKAGTYKDTATNPGQFYYNVFYVSSGSVTTMDIDLPPTFETQGANPVHVYTGVGINTSGCYIPSGGLTGFTSSISGNEISVSGAFPEFAYVTVHSDFALKGRTGLAKDLDNNVVLFSSQSTIVLADLAGHTFSYSVGGTTIDEKTIVNINNFKNDPGFVGIVTDTSEQPVAGIRVAIYKGSTPSSSNLIGITATNEDGYYFYNYKYTGKATTFTVKLLDYPLIPAVTKTVKSNSFMVVDFVVPA